MSGVAVIGTNVVDYYGVPAEQFPQELCDLAPPGTLFLGHPQELPAITDQQYSHYIQEGWGRIGGQGNTSPQIARAGLDVFGIGALGRGSHAVLDPSGEYIKKGQLENGVVPYHQIHEQLATGTTFIVKGPENERPGIVYFPNSNLETDLGFVLESLKHARPAIMHWMYVGLMGRSDRRLPQFFDQCKKDVGCIVSVDTHTLVNDPSRRPDLWGTDQVNPHKLLGEILPHVDMFFCSNDEAKLISAALGFPCADALLKGEDFENAVAHFLNDLHRICGSGASAMYGVTTSDGAYVSVGGRDPSFIQTRYKVSFANGNLVGAGDGFRSGLLSYTATHADEFRGAVMNVEEAVQVANLIAVLSISAPVEDRFGQIPFYDKVEALVRSGKSFRGQPLENLLAALRK